MRTETCSDVRPGQPLQQAATVVAVVFIVIGVAGFTPALTQDLDHLTWVGPNGAVPHAELLGVFHVSALQNLVHLVFGIGLLMSRTVAGARAFLIGGGLLYSVVPIYGLLVTRDSDWNFLPIADADNWLHLGLSAGMLLLGLVLDPLEARGIRHPSCPDAGQGDASSRHGSMSVTDCGVLRRREGHD